MNGQAQQNLANRDSDQLQQLGRELHNQAVFEALAKMFSAVKSVVPKFADAPAGGSQLKQS